MRVETLINLNMALSPIGQNIFDDIWAKIKTCGATSVTLTISDIDPTTFPKIIVDHGDVIHSLVQHIRDREIAKAKP